MREHEKRSEMWWQTLAAKVFVGLVALLGGYLLFRYAVGILLPFLIACALGAAVHPLATRVSGRTRVPQGLCAAVLMKTPWTEDPGGLQYIELQRVGQD